MFSTKNIVGFMILGLAIGASNCGKEKENPPATLLNQKLSYGTIEDIDRNEYATIRIGDQTWMAENLKTSRYSNGDTIPNVTERWKWHGLTTGAWCYFLNDSTFNTLYGKLYNWEVAADPRNVCPKGWHVPSDTDWDQLIHFLGGPDEAGRKMKTQLKGHWYDDDRLASNESGFSSLPSGGRGLDAGFNLLTYRASYWSTIESNVSEEWAMGYTLFWNGDGIGGDNTENKYYGYCIRCLKD